VGKGGVPDVPVQKAVRTPGLCSKARCTFLTLAPRGQLLLFDLPDLERRPGRGGGSTTDTACEGTAPALNGLSPLVQGLIRVLQTTSGRLRARRLSQEGHG
jgi:hypothetical protein